jgi:hypothetical protein
MTTSNPDEQQFQPGETLPGKPQEIFALCQIQGLREIRALVDELEDLLQAAGMKVSILKYGMTSKERQSFLVLTCDEGIPPSFESKLQRDSDIADYVIYDALIGKSDNE